MPPLVEQFNRMSADNPHRSTLRRLMRQNNLTCGAVAKIVRKQPQTVRRWHCGLTPAPFASVAYLDMYLRMNRGTQLS